MKRTILLLAITAFLFSALVADDFILKSGQIVFGTLVGIKDNYMYVLDDGDQLAIISFDQISEIETNAGRSVFGVWSMRKPFMKIDPLVYKDRTAYFDDKKDEDSNSNIQIERSDPASSIQYHEEQTDYNVPGDKTTSQSSLQNKQPLKHLFTTVLKWELILFPNILLSLTIGHINGEKQKNLLTYSGLNH